MSKKPITVTTENIDDLIRSIKEKMKGSTQKGYVVYLPPTERVLSKRYRGKGRPKKSDYDYEKIDWDKIFTLSNKFATIEGQGGNSERTAYTTKTIL